MKWIKCSKEMPPENKYYIVYSSRIRNKSSKKIFKFVYVAALLKTFSGSYKWFAWGRSNELIGVTHWMPLPSEPKDME